MNAEISPPALCEQIVSGYPEACRTSSAAGCERIGNRALLFAGRILEADAQQQAEIWDKIHAEQAALGQRCMGQVPPSDEDCRPQWTCRYDKQYRPS